MAQQEVYMTGVSGWTHLGSPGKYGNYTVDMYLDDDSWEKFDTVGLQLKPKEDEKGRYVTFRRPPQQQLISGKIIDHGAPKIVDEEGVTFEEPNRIWQGSTLTCRLVVYDTVKGKGHRLEAVRVEELAEREDGEGQDPALVDIDVPF